MTLVVMRGSPAWGYAAADRGVWRIGCDSVDPATQRAELLPETTSKLYAIGDGWLAIGGPLNVADRVAAHLTGSDFPVHVPELRPLVGTALAEMSPADADYAARTLKLLWLGPCATGFGVSLIEWETGRVRACAGMTALPTLGIERDELLRLLKPYDGAVSRARTVAALARATAEFVTAVRQRSGCVSSMFEIALLMRAPSGKVLRWKSAPLSEPDPLLVEVGAL